MNVDTLVGVATNTALLLALAVLYDALPLDSGRRTRLLEVVAGLVIGLIGLVVMLTPWRYSEGVIFDTRSILLSVSGLYFGPIPTAIAMLMTGALRIYQGGGGVYMGLGVIVTSAALGLLWRFYLASKKKTQVWYQLYAFGLVVHVCMLLWTFALPGDVRAEVLRTIAVPVMLIYPIGTVLLGLLLARREHLRSWRRSLQEERDLFEAITETSPVGILTTDGDGQIKYANSRAESIMGLSRDEITQRAYNAPAWKITGAEGGVFPEEQLPFRRVLDGGTVVRNVIHGIEWPDGRRVLLSVNAAPLRDDTGRTQGMVASVEDVTERRRAERTLRESEERFRRLSENARDLIYRMSLPDGRYEYVSRAAEQILGYSPQELYESPKLMQGAIHPDWLPYFEKQWANLVKGTMPPTYEYQIVHKSGEVRWLNQRNILVRDENGAPVAIEGIVTDVTERKQTEAGLRASESKYHSLYDSMTELVAIHEIVSDATDKAVDYRIVDCNPAFERVTGIAREQAVGALASQLYGAGEPPYLDIYARVAATGEPASFETTFAPMSKSFEISAFSTSPGMFATVSADITERKRAEAELRRLNVSLDLRVAQRTAQLSAANAELQAFAYSVSHDLRAPLRAIHSFSQILTRRHSEVLNQEGREYLEHVVNASEQMGRLIEDLLQYSRLGRRAVQRGSVNSEEILRLVLDHFSEAIEKSGAEVSVPRVLPAVYGDETLLNQVFLNLIDNALKYQPRDQKPRVEVTWQEQEDWIILHVKDNGIGIPAEHHERIFNVFQRLQSEDAYPGTGIGLALVKKAVDLMEGQMGVESQVGAGSHFWVRLPALANPNLAQRDTQQGVERNSGS